MCKEECAPPRQCNVSKNLVILQSSTKPLSFARMSALNIRISDPKKLNQSRRLCVQGEKLGEIYPKTTKLFQIYC